MEKNINKPASLLKDGCFDGKSQYSRDVSNIAKVAKIVKYNSNKIEIMADVVNVVVSMGRLNLQEMRLPHPILKQKRLLASIIVLRNEIVPIDHHFFLEEFVE